MDEYIDVPVKFDEETMEKFNKTTKKELIEKFCSAATEAYVFKLRTQTAIEDVDRLEKENKRLDAALTKAESYVEQARGMIEAIMEKWYHYDS